MTNKQNTMRISQLELRNPHNKAIKYERDFAHRVKKRRNEWGWSQSYVAAELGIDASQYNRIENGRARLSAGCMLELAHLFSMQPCVCRACLGAKNQQEESGNIKSLQTRIDKLEALLRVQDK